jgi:hypothetical protein
MYASLLQSVCGKEMDILIVPAMDVGDARENSYCAAGSILRMY